jgi:hypothetical protein
MSCGWIRVNLPEVLCRTGHWHIHVGQVRGHPNELIDVPAGAHPVVIHVALDWDLVKMRCKIEVEAFVVNGDVTDIRLPLPGTNCARTLNVLQ